MWPLFDHIWAVFGAQCPHSVHKIPINPDRYLSLCPHIVHEGQTAQRKSDDTIIKLNRKNGLKDLSNFCFVANL